MTLDRGPAAAQAPDGLSALRALRASDYVVLDDLVDLAARLLDADAAQLWVVAGREEALSSVGVDADDPDAVTVRTATVSTGRVVVSEATAADGSGPRAHLGVPLLGGGGEVLGALCVLHPAPRAWTDAEVGFLARFASSVVAQLELVALSADYAEERVVWQLAVDAAGIGAFDLDLTTGELRWDDRLLELFGLDRSTFGGTIEAFLAALHPQDVARVREALVAAVEACGEFALEYRVVLPTGGIQWVGARGRALPGPDGTAVRFVGAAYDTTAARDGEIRVVRVLESMPSAFYQLDHDWRFSYVNAEAERLLGSAREDLLGGDIWELFPAAAGADFETHYRHAVASGEPVTFDAYYPPPLDGWYELRAWPTPDGLSVYFLEITDRVEAQEAAAAGAQRSALLARVSDELGKTLDVEESVARLASVVVPDLAEWCLVTVVDEPARTDWRLRLRDVGWWHADPEQRPLVERYAALRVPALTDSSFVARALAGDEPVLIERDAAAAVRRILKPGEAADLMALLAPEAGVVVPLQGRGRTVGMLSVFRGAAGSAFSPEDLATLRDVAARAGLALDNARLFGQQRDLAEGLQRNMLTAPPEPDHLHVVVRYEPAAQAAQVGGDWYDSFLQRDGSTVVVIGDVVGHDTAAAAAMGQVRGLLRGIAVHSGSGPAEVLRGVDEVMATLQLDTTATAVVARLEQTPEERLAGLTRLRWTSAGHPPPIVVTEDGEVRTLTPTDPEPDLLLGLDPGTQRREHVVTLERGTTVLLYTDGLVERRGQDLDTGIDLLRQVLSDLVADGTALDDLCDELLRRLLPTDPEDDVALVAVRLHHQDRPRPAEAGPRRVPTMVP
ncbi:SpoIIE family protein phosphatase [Nocardioides dongkuii]|uniref:SpoIIE family protein phosphatase n=1 Tax=Nocardioides dongkuii TaxID=2760089 RepID=UPI0015FDF33B|nr:SpoIIE family protein phosphatase [Nocardioides dongkuii]